MAGYLLDPGRWVRMMLRYEYGLPVLLWRWWYMQSAAWLRILSA
ncbi:MAG TPA: hypothetical protein VK686_19460 [Bryobacteraceae bacterium]|jgi:hypothetical protein|nr:hypothetical protein [Bryobacteraceae bacterium]